ncbi:MAG: corrinoid protein [Coriobacteriales bacterium]|jgi:corrinoid protein of di/trimethylamine methyltransferase|nr:corrinoid protein [Coriobacteriales bacterium]
MSRVEEIYELVLKGRAKDISEKVAQAIDAGDDPKELMNSGMIAAMAEIGERFSRGELFVPEMMISAKAMQKGLETLKPFLSEEESAGIGTIVIATVAGDLHDIGKNLVAMMLESSGFEVIDLGCDVPVDAFIQAVKDNPNVSLVCASALLTTTMPAMKEIVNALIEAGLRDQVKVLIGGAPVTQKFCDEIGADGYGEDAAAAIRLAKGYIAA